MCRVYWVVDANNPQEQMSGCVIIELYGNKIKKTKKEESPVEARCKESA